MWHWSDGGKGSSVHDQTVLLTQSESFDELWDDELGEVSGSVTVDVDLVRDFLFGLVNQKVGTSNSDIVADDGDI